MNLNIKSIVLITFISCISSSEIINKDGFNIYKDYVRGRSDEMFPEIPAAADRTLFVYRTPLQLYPGLLPSDFDQEYRKRNGNAFKNHMLNKDQMTILGKRSSKAALSQMLGNKHDLYTRDVGSCYGK